MKKEKELEFYKREVEKLNAFLSSLTDNLPVHIASVDNDGYFTFWNKASERLFGYKEEEVIGKIRGRDLVLGKLDLEEVKKNIKKFGKYEANLKLRRKNGTSFDGHIIVVNQYDKNGNIIGKSAIITDISKEKEKEKRLQESRRMWQSLTEEAPVAIIIHNGKSVLYANSVALKLMRVTNINELNKKPIIEYVHPDYRDIAINRIKNAFSGKKQKIEYEKLITCNGETIDVEVIATPVEYEGKKAILTIVHNITDMKKIENELRKSRLLYRLLFENMNTANALVDDDTTILLCNKPLEDLLGYTKEEIEGKKKWTEFVYKEDLDRLLKYNTGRRLAPETVPSRYEARMVNRQGEIRDILINVGIVEETSQRIVSIIDITEKKIAEKKIEKLNKILKMLSDCNQILIRSNNESNMINEICEKIVDIGGYELAWVGYNDGNILKYIGGYFKADILFERKNIEITNKECPIYKSLSSHTIEVVKDLTQHVCPECNIRKSIEDNNLKSFIVLPIFIEGKLNGTLNIFSSRKNAFDDEEVKILKELAGDISYGLKTIRISNEKAQIEEELRKNITKYMALFDGAPDAIFIETMDGQIIDCNKKAVEMYGYTKEELLKLKVSDMVPENKVSLNKIVDALLQRGEFFGEAVNIKKDGTQFPIEAAVKLVNVGEENLVFAIIRDISERKKIESLLKDSEMRYRAIVENYDGYIYIVSADNKIEFANKNLIEKLGFDPIGQKCYQILYNKPDVCEWCNKETVLNGNTIRNEFFSEKEGKWYYRISSPLKHPDGSMSIQTMIVDITDRKQAEEVLKESHKRLEEIVNERTETLKRLNKELEREKEQLKTTLESIGEGVIVTDSEGNITLINPVAQRLTGYTDDKAIGKHISQVFYVVDKNTEKRYEDLFKIIADKGEIGGLTNNVLLISRDGSEHIIDNSGAPIRDEKGNLIGVVIVFRDITEKKRIEEELYKAGKLESLGLLAGGIAHDFNNILAIIMSNITLAKLAIKDEEIIKRLNNVQNACMRAKDLSGQLLTFAHGGAPIKKEANIVELIKETVGFSLSGSNVRCKFSFAENLWGVSVDKAQISQVLNNLIINAIQAMEGGGNIYISVSNFKSKDSKTIPLKDGDYLKISIRDEGIGILPQDLPHIFDPYFTTKQNGSGLGLAIVYSIIKKHNGYITVESKPGRGTVFTIYLPATKKTSSKTPTDTQKQHNKSQRGIKVLIMDDEEPILEVLSEVLSHYGYESICTKNGWEAIKEYKNAIEIGKPFDIVIMDLTIPGGMGGRETIKRLREIDPNIKAIVSSGYSNDEVVANYKKYGFLEVLIKPYKIDVLIKTIEKALKQQL